MKVLDVNVVLAAHRDDHPQHDVAWSWLGLLVRTQAPFAVTDMVAGAFLRLTTNRRIFETPTPADAAFEYLVALRAQTGHVLLAPGPRHLDILRKLCLGADAVGDLVPDAQLAAIAIEHAAEVVSFDRDFARFDMLRWSRPV